MVRSTFFKLSTLNVLLINSTTSIIPEFLRIEPGAAGWEAQTLHLCYAAPLIAHSLSYLAHGKAVTLGSNPARLVLGATTKSYSPSQYLFIPRPWAPTSFISDFLRFELFPFELPSRSPKCTDFVDHKVQVNTPEYEDSGFNAAQRTVLMFVEQFIDCNMKLKRLK